MNNQFPDDDERLVGFLRQHVGDTPPASPHLEAQILQAIATSPQLSSKHQTWWKIPSALAAGLLVSFGGYRLFNPPQLVVDAESLETFMVSNWQSVVGETSEPTPTDSAHADWQILATSPERETF